MPTQLPRREALARGVLVEGHVENKAEQIVGFEAVLLGRGL